MSTRSNLSLDQIETACILQAVGQDGCTVGELCGRLHISPTSIHCVQRVVDVLIKRGLVETVESTNQLSSAGLQYLAEIGIKPYRPKTRRGGKLHAVGANSV